MSNSIVQRAPAPLQILRQMLAFTVSMLLFMLLAPTAKAQPLGQGEWPGRVGRLVEIQGAVRLLDQAENEWITASINRPLTSGDHLVTEIGSRAELRIGSTTVRLDGRSDLEIRQLDDEAIVLQLNAGSLALKVVSQELLSQVEVLTVEGRFRPRTVGHFRIDRRDDASEATSWRGELNFEGRDSTLQIPAGRRAELWLKGPAQVTHYNWSEAERDSFADWVAYDDTNAERSVTAQYVSPEMTGWEDLDRYGNWQTHPEYGSVWIPTAVGASWVPYRSGHWAWVAPWGWSWVDDARWGFAPFHYGRWVFWNRRWCWSPGPRVHRPAYAPALVGWVGGVQAGVSGQRVAPPVAWVPLGPRDVYRPHPGWRDGFDRDGRDGRDGRDWRGNRGDERQRQPGSPQRAAPDALFSNQYVPGAVTAVAGDAFLHRRAVTPVPVPVTSLPRQPVAPAAPPAAPPSVRRGGPGGVPSASEGRGAVPSTGEGRGGPAAVPVFPRPAPNGAAQERVPPTAGTRGGPFYTAPGTPPAAVPTAPATAVPAAPPANVPHAPPTAVPTRPDSPPPVPVAPPNAVPTRPEPGARPDTGVRPEVPGRRGEPGTRFDPGARNEDRSQREGRNPRAEPEARQEPVRPPAAVPQAPPTPAVQPQPQPPQTMPSHRAVPTPAPQAAPQPAPQPVPQPAPRPAPQAAPQPVPQAAPQPAPAPMRAPPPAAAPRAAPPVPTPAPTPAPPPAPPAPRKPDNERAPEQRQNPRQNER